MIYETLRSVHTMGEVVMFELAGRSGKPDKLRLNASLIGALAVALKGAQTHFDQRSGAAVDVQPLAVTSFRKAFDASGRAMLELGIEGVLTQILLPPETLSALRSELAGLSAMSAPAPTGQRH